ncbi:MAG TPA: hypothetical protein VHW23_24460 [Kofleriaceae bacterium]|nr:hypothetical protein [Kofleriaceae bacterium]
MRALRLAFLVIGASAGAACGAAGNIQNLPLRWQGVELPPHASASVARALAVSPLSLGLRDLRPDPTAVGVYQDTGFVVRTTDNVGQYCTDRLGEMLVRAGAHLEPSAPTVLEAELLDYQVVEGGTFDGTVRMRTTLRRGGNAVWTKTYTGANHRWGRTHKPENFNESLSGSLADATQQLLNDDEFARTLGEPPSDRPLDRPGLPVAPPGAAAPQPGSSRG